MELQSGEKYQLADLIEYKSGSIISTRVRNNRSTSITLFSFDSGQELTEHTSPFEALVTILDGSAKISIEGKPYHLASGDLILLPANVPHSVFAERQFSMLLTIIKE